MKGGGDMQQYLNTKTALRPTTLRQGVGLAYVLDCRGGNALCNAARHGALCVVQIAVPPNLASKGFLPPSGICGCGSP
jgi:hypothetical protein